MKDSTLMLRVQRVPTKAEGGVLFSSFTEITHCMLLLLYKGILMKSHREQHSAEEAVPLHVESTEASQRFSYGSSGKPSFVILALILSLAINIVFSITAFYRAFLGGPQCLSPYGMICIIYAKVVPQNSSSNQHVWLEISQLHIAPTLLLDLVVVRKQSEPKFGKVLTQALERSVSVKSGPTPTDFQNLHHSCGTRTGKYIF
jgi:hypothetical protein